MSIDDAVEPETRSAVASALLAQQRERVDVAEQLHAQPVQVLTAAALRLGTLARAGGEAAELADELQDSLDEAIGQLRRLVRRLRTSDLEDGVVPALRRELEEVRQSFPEVVTSLDADELESLPSLPAAVICLRIARATFSALRHEHKPTRIAIRLAGAARMSCSITVEGERVPELRAELGAKLREWFDVVRSVGGAWSVRIQEASVVVVFALPADL